jgi:hypothetical protein
VGVYQAPAGNHIDWPGDLEGEELSDEQAKQDIREAIKNLRLNEEPLKVMNYMKVVADWASDKKL